MGRHFAGSRSQAGLGGQYGGAAHAVATGDDEGIAHLALMGKRIAREHSRTNIVFAEQGVVGLYLVDAFLTQADVEYLHLSDIDLILWEQEGQLQLLECQRQVGADDVCPHVSGIVLCHEARRHVDADDFRLRGVDIFDQ